MGKQRDLKTWFWAKKGCGWEDISRTLKYGIEK